MTTTYTLDLTQQDRDLIIRILGQHWGDLDHARPTTYATQGPQAEHKLIKEQQQITSITRQLLGWDTHQKAQL